jgi:hypothetical protein
LKIAKGFSKPNAELGPIRLIARQIQVINSHVTKGNYGILIPRSKSTLENLTISDLRLFYLVEAPVSAATSGRNTPNVQGRVAKKKAFVRLILGADSD